MRINRVVVAGGGAAGMMAAITAARFGAEVTYLIIFTEIFLN